MKIITILALSAMLLTSCSYIQSGNIDNNMGNIQENIVSFGNGKFDLEDKNVQIDFTENSYSLYAGCNNMSGTYTIINNSEISFQQPVTTMMLCSDEIMTLENNIAQEITEVSSFVFTGDRLELSGENINLNFVEAQNNILHTNWKLNSILVGSGIVSDILFENSHLNLSDTGEMSGIAICNNIVGTFESTDNTISFGPIGMTKKMCSGEQASEYEIKIVEALENVSIIELSRSNLILTSVDGKYKLNYSAQ